MVSPRAFAASLVALAAVPLHAAPVNPVYKVVRSGALAPMGFHHHLEDGCRSPGPVAVNLITPPRDGEVSEGPRNAHPSYEAKSHLAARNRIRVRGTQVYDRSAPSYTGPNSYVIQRVFPNGDAQRFRIDVSVR